MNYITKFDPIYRYFINSIYILSKDFFLSWYKIVKSGDAQRGITNNFT